MIVIDSEEPLIDADDRSSVPLDTLKVPAGKKRRVKSPTPARAASTTPVRRSRSKTPFNLYLSRHSADPNEPTKWRSITPFINRKDKELTPFELGKDLKSQLISHKMVFDKASVMDISESDFEPVRYITSDVSVIDRASVMDISNVEVIYLVEEYDEEDLIDEEKDEEDKEESSKKKKGKKGRKSKSMDKEDSPSETGEAKKKETKTKKKVEKKKKEDSRSPSPPPLPKLTLKLELGGGSKMNKKMFEQKPAIEAKPPAKKIIKPSVQSTQDIKEDTLTAETTRKSESQDIEEIIETDDNLEEDLKVDENIEQIDSEVNEENKVTEMAEDGLEVNVEMEQGIDIKTITPEQGQNNNEQATKIDEQATKNETVVKEKPRKKIIEVKDPSPTKEQLEYWDKISNEEGHRFMEKIKKFTLQKRNDPKNPCFINHLPNSTALEGQKLRLVCSVNGIDLSIKWFKNGEEIRSGSDRYKIRSDNNNILSLEILKCIPSDTGEYSCLISNKQKKVQSCCFVSIYDLSRFQDEPCPPNIDNIEDSYHYLNDELMIQCQVHGCPRPTLTWSRENYEIKEEHTLIEEAHGIHRMIIKNPCSNDTGIYVLTAVNSRGQYERKHCVEFFINTEKVIY